jgi:hypothetical protein
MERVTRNALLGCAQSNGDTISPVVDLDSDWSFRSGVLSFPGVSSGVVEVKKTGTTEREAIRDKSLLREFDEYKTSTQRKLKVFRTEAVRVGFKACWQERDYSTIVKIAEKLPDTVLEEDEKLLMYFDNALTRLGGEL